MVVDDRINDGAWGLAVRRIVLLGLLGLSLAACARTVPDSNPGVGFGDYAAFELERARREAALAQTIPGAAPLLPPVTGIAQPVAPVPPGGIPTSALAAAGIGTSTLPPAGAAPAGTSDIYAAPMDALVLPDGTPLDAAGLAARAGLAASPSNPAPGGAGGGISDEQDFDAVASRESIESDAARLAQAAAAYQVVLPTALPSAPQDAGPNIVEYALNAPNRLGQEWYSRFALSGQGRFERNCASYRSPDEAQRDFLSRGGPDRDPRGIDPDGDGFACGWDPAPFLLAVGQG